MCFEQYEQEQPCCIRNLPFKIKSTDIEFIGFNKASDLKSPLLLGSLATNQTAYCVQLGAAIFPRKSKIENPVSEDFDVVSSLN